MADKWLNDYSAILTWPDEESGEDPSSLLDIVLLPISHHFLCNCRLTLHHENFPHEVNWVSVFWSKL